VAEESDRYAVALDNLQENLPDIIAYLQNETNLTRKPL
jgi:type III restriction enzyme